jgi:hypothetical protein
MHRVFVSYHHANDQWYKEELIRWSNENEIFEDWSVHAGDIPDEWDDEDIRIEIRDKYLRQSTVTIVLVGTETRNRKHVDWELYSSMRDSENNPKSGIIAIMLPSTGCTHVHADHKNENIDVFPSFSGWHPVSSREECKRDYPYLPERIIDQVVSSEAKVSIVNWDNIYPNYPERLKILIENAYKDRENCKYDLARRMKRINS